MSIRIVELGRIGAETKGNPSMLCPLFEVAPKTQRRNSLNDIGP